MAVGLRGVLLYGAAAVGMSSGDPTMDLDTIDTDKFSPFFTGGAWISSPTPPPLAASSTIAAVLPKAEASPLPAVSPRVLPASEPSSVPPAAVAPLPPSAPAAPPGPIGERAKKFARLALAGDEGAALRLLREFRSLGRDARPALPAIAKIGRDFHVASEVQSQALAALGDIGGPEAAGLLADAMGDRSPSVQALASQALGRLRGDDVRGVMPRLAADLERRCPIATNAKPVEMGFCYSGLSAIRAIGPDAEGATASLIRLVRAGDWSSNMKHHAIRAIGAIGPRARDAVPALIELLGAGPEEGAEALRSLGAIGPPAVDALPALRRLLAATDKKGPEESVEQLAFRKALITSTIAQIQSGG